MFKTTGDAESGTIMSNVFQEEPACAKICPNLSFNQRVLGFAVCAVLGWILSLVGTLTLIGGPSSANINAFVVLYILGSIIALCATGFLLGPKSQCTKMWHPTRRFTTGFYLIMLIIVFAVAVSKQNIGIVLFLLFIEILAAAWYGISYIPFARKMISQFFRNLGICYPCYFVYDSIQESQNKSSGNSTSMFGGK